MSESRNNSPEFMLVVNFEGSKLFLFGANCFYLLMLLLKLSI